MSLFSRAFEIDGIPAVMTVPRDGGIARRAKAARIVMTGLPRGAVFGTPHDVAQQRRILEATLDLFKQSAPIAPVKLDESISTQD